MEEQTTRLLKDLLRTVVPGQETAVDVTRELLGEAGADGKRITLAIQQRHLNAEPLADPIRERSPRRMHTFYGVGGFCRYLNEFGGQIALGDREELAVRAALKNRHRGEPAAIPKPRLLQALAAAGVPIYYRDLDELLQTQRAAGFPVAATDSGVFWAVSREELEKARHYVTSRFGELRATVAAYDRILEGWGSTAMPGQAPAGMLFDARPGRT